MQMWLCLWMWISLWLLMAGLVSHVPVPTDAHSVTSPCSALRARADVDTAMEHEAWILVISAKGCHINIWEKSTGFSLNTCPLAVPWLLPILRENALRCRTDISFHLIFLELMKYPVRIIPLNPFKYCFVIRIQIWKNISKYKAIIRLDNRNLTIGIVFEKVENGTLKKQGQYFDTCKLENRLMRVQRM